MYLLSHFVNVSLKLINTKLEVGLSHPHCQLQQILLKEGLVTILFGSAIFHSFTSLTTADFLVRGRLFETEVWCCCFQELYRLFQPYLSLHKKVRL